jgi:RimJ/RimL family protein N-acetyltransferase
MYIGQSRQLKTWHHQYRKVSLYIYKLLYVYLSHQLPPRPATRKISAHSRIPYTGFPVISNLGLIYSTFVPVFHRRFVSRQVNMATPPLGFPVSNTTPACLPGPDPLIGKHVVLERLSTSHTADLYEAVGTNDGLWTYLPEGPFSNTSDFAHHIAQKSAKPDHAFYAILLQGKAVGHVCLFRADLPNQAIEVGHVLYGAQLQRTRAGTEVLYLLGQLVFSTLGYRRWEWKCNALNSASKRAAERYGFTYEGTFRQHMIVKGRNRDTAWYAIVDGEWAAEREVFETWLGDGNFDGEGKQRRTLGHVREGLEKREWSRGA